MAGLACIGCAFLQGTSDPDLHQLSVSSLFSSVLRSKSPLTPGITLPPRQVRGQRSLGDCVRLHGRDVPHCDQEPGGGNLLPGGQDRRRHQPPARPLEGDDNTELLSSLMRFKCRKFS